VSRGELYFERSGLGATSIVFVHAGIADLTMWEPQVEAFAPSYDVVCFDARGFGRSRSEPGAFSPVEDLRAVLDRLGIDSAVLVGCSRGGAHALDFAVDSPDRVRALAWVCGGVSGRPETAPPAEEAAMFERIEKLWEAKEFDALVDLETHVWVDGPLQPEGRAPADVRERIGRLIYDLETRDEIDLRPEPPRLEAATNLDRITCPVLVVVGALDTIGTRAAADLLSQSAPHAERVDFPDSAHLPNLEHPERFNRGLSEFLARHDL
jgi:pimeloyl-ACP methyl ester carboxylesterase